MTTKFDVLPYLVMGLSPKEIAARLGCLPAYVRAVRAREFGNGRDVQRRYRERVDYPRRKERYRTDPEYRRMRAEYNRRSKQRRALVASSGGTP